MKPRNFPAPPTLVPAGIWESRTEPGRLPLQDHARRGCAGRVPHPVESEPRVQVRCFRRGKDTARAIFSSSRNPETHGSKGNCHRLVNGLIFWRGEIPLFSPLCLLSCLRLCTGSKRLSQSSAPSAAERTCKGRANGGDQFTARRAGPDPTPFEVALHVGT